jgi:HEAT repeat protein
MVPVLQQALQERIQDLRNPKSTTEEKQAMEVTSLVVEELGRLKATQTARYVWEVVQSVEDPMLKSEAIIALGKMGAKQYAVDMARMLRNINFNYDQIQNQRANETLAYALVKALERFKDPVGYKPVFFASTGWYSSRSGVKERAEEALSVIVDNPTEQLTEIIKDEDNFRIKLQALEAELDSNAPPADKASVAALAFKESIQKVAQNKIERRELKELRVVSLNAIQQISEKDQDAVPYMQEMILGYRKDRIYDIDEMLALLNAMGTYSSDPVARTLSDFLRYFNERREFSPPDSFRIVKATIIALGNTGNPIAIEELNMVIISQYWESSVRNLAEEALEKVKQ